MYAKPVQALPEGKRWLHEVELDGYRCLAGKESERGNTAPHGSCRSWLVMLALPLRLN